MSETLSKLAGLPPPDIKRAAAMGSYVYAYVRPDLSPYYIGIGTTAYRPFQAHTCRVPSDRRAIRILRAGLSWDDAAKWERLYISRFGRKDLGTGILRNLTDGGDGTLGRIKTQAERQAIAQAKRNMPAEERAKRSEIQRRIEADKRLSLLAALQLTEAELLQLRQQRKKERNAIHEATRPKRAFTGRTAEQKERNRLAAQRVRDKKAAQGLPTYTPRTPEQKQRQAEAARRYRQRVKANSNLATS
jgi:hypothetical protein